MILPRPPLAGSRRKCLARAAIKSAVTYALLVAGNLAIAGCSSNLRDALAQLHDSVEAYNEAYRWKNYERASMFVPTDVRAAFLSTYEDEENSLHIEDYQILKVDVESDTSAVVTIRVRYTLLPSVTIEKKTLVQHWHRLGGAWILESEENSIRAMMTDEEPSASRTNGSRAPRSRGEEGTENAIEVTSPDGTVIREEGEISP